MVQQARRANDRLDMLWIERDVLAGCIVDARRDHVDPSGSSSMPGIGTPGEGGRMGGQDIVAQEVPRRSGDRVGHVDPNMAGTHDGRSGGNQAGHQAERLRIVDDHDVAGGHQGEDRAQVRPGYVVVVRTFRPGSRRNPVTEVTVEAVVDPLRDLEERGIGVDDEPTGGDAVIGQIAETRTEEFRDAATFGRRVDLPDGVAAQGGTHGSNERVIVATASAPAIERRRSASRRTIGTSNTGRSRVTVGVVTPGTVPRVRVHVASSEGPVCRGSHGRHRRR